MKQLLVGVGGYATSANPYYTSLCGGCAIQSNIGYTKQVVSTPGTLSHLIIQIDLAVGDGASNVLTVMKNGVATELEVTISGASDTTGYDDTHEVSVSAGDTICLKSTPVDTEEIRAMRFSLLFNGTEANESLLLGLGSTYISADRYHSVMQGTYPASATEAPTIEVIPTAGTIKNLYVKLSSSPADAGESTKGYVFVLRQNGAETDLSCSIYADGLSGSDTTHEISVSAGDYVSFAIKITDPIPRYNVQAYWGMTFVADTGGEFLFLGSSAAPATSTRYNHLVTREFNQIWETDETIYIAPLQGVNLSKFYVRLSAAPGADNSRQISVRGNSASKITVTISDTDVTGNDTSTIWGTTMWDLVDIMHIPVTSPDAATVHWGITGFIPSSFSKGYVIG